MHVSKQSFIHEFAQHLIIYALQIVHRSCKDQLRQTPVPSLSAFINIVHHVHHSSSASSIIIDATTITINRQRHHRSWIIDFHEHRSKHHHPTSASPLIIIIEHRQRLPSSSMAFQIRIAGRLQCSNCIQNTYKNEGLQTLFLMSDGKNWKSGQKKSQCHESSIGSLDSLCPMIKFIANPAIPPVCLGLSKNRVAARLRNFHRRENNAMKLVFLRGG